MSEINKDNKELIPVRQDLANTNLNKFMQELETIKKIDDAYLKNLINQTPVNEYFENLNNELKEFKLTNHFKSEKINNYFADLLNNDPFKNRLRVNAQYLKVENNQIYAKNAKSLKINPKQQVLKWVLSGLLAGFLFIGFILSIAFFIAFNKYLINTNESHPLALLTYNMNTILLSFSLFGWLFVPLIPWIISFSSRRINTASNWRRFLDYLWKTLWILVVFCIISFSLIAIISASYSIFATKIFIGDQSAQKSYLAILGIIISLNAIGVGISLASGYLKQKVI